MTVASNWLSPPIKLQLEAHAVHLWRAGLDHEHAIVERSERLLSEDERDRARRFVFQRDRNRFITARGVLRSIIARYTGRPAHSLSFDYEARGKPRLRLHDTDPPLLFNVSHAHGLAVFAFSYDREIGVDVEAIRADVARDEIAEQFFSASELSELRELPQERRDEGFFLCWTRKEAYVKALGAGLGLPLDSFNVSLTPGMPELLRSSDSARWTLRSFQPQAGYVGAVVAEGRDWKVRQWDVNPDWGFDARRSN